MREVLFLFHDGRRWFVKKELDDHVCSAEAVPSVLRHVSVCHVLPGCVLVQETIQKSMAEKFCEKIPRTCGAGEKCLGGCVRVGC